MIHFRYLIGIFILLIKKLTDYCTLVPFSFIKLSIVCTAMFSELVFRI
jgi:hypothetical protein